MKIFCALAGSALVLSLATVAFAQAPQSGSTSSRDAALKECSDQAMREVPVARAEPNDPAYAMRYNVYAGCLARKKMNP